MSPQAQHEIIVHFLDGSEEIAVRTGNNAAWRCQCGREPPLIGYSDALNSVHQYSLVVCPNENCARVFRVVAQGLKQAPTHVQEIHA